MKTQKNRIQWLPLLIIVWNLIDIAVHVAVDMVEVLRVSGNGVAIGAAVLILILGTKKWSHDVLIGTAAIVVILNSIFSFQAGFALPMLVFVGVTVFLLIRWAQVKRLDYAAAASGEGGELQIRFSHRWWMALALTFVGILIVALVGFAFSPPEAACLDDVDIEIMTTASGVEFVRTPEECFDDLTDWPYEAQYVEIDGMRQAYVDEGTGESGETILMLHGQPTWSYLYRKMIPVLAEAGHRVIVMDHLGMGRSDKPIDPDYYTYLDHSERLEAFIQELGLEQGNLTIFVQDWGSLIGLKVIGDNPEWFDRVVVGNGFLPEFEEEKVPFNMPENPNLTRQLAHFSLINAPAQQEPLYDKDGNRTDANGLDANEIFGIWIDYARNDERFVPSIVVESQTYFPLTDEEEAAYDAPFPSRLFMGGVRAFPGLVYQLPGLTQESWEGLVTFEKPFLTIWGNNDPGNLGLPETQQALLDRIPGTEGWDHVRLPEASHFLQDDQGVEIANRVNEFIEASLPEEQEYRLMKMLQINWVKWALIPLGLIIPVALLVLSWHFGRRFADRGHGGIVLFSSIVGFQGMPNSTNYAATKAYVQSLGEALNIELAPFGVDVLTSAPGPVDYWTKSAPQPRHWTNDLGFAEWRSVCGQSRRVHFCYPSSSK